MTIGKISPVVKSIEVRRSADEAFAIFTQEISAWWPLATHTRARSAEGQTTERITIEPRVGGRVYETLTDGQALEWGEVLAFSPGVLLELNWRMGRPIDEGTHVRVQFEPLTPASCRVTLTHDGWERLRDDAVRMRNAYDQGWITVFELGFARHAGRP